MHKARKLAIQQQNNQISTINSFNRTNLPFSELHYRRAFQKKNKLKSKCIVCEKCKKLIDEDVILCAGVDEISPGKSFFLFFFFFSFLFFF